MKARLRSWWQKIKQYRVAIGIVAFILVVAVVLLILVAWFYGTGFNGYNQVTTARTIRGPSAGTVIRTEVSQPGKTLWDWLQLLIIPFALAIIALVFQLANTRTERSIAKERYVQDQQIALDKQREDLLQAYLDRMSELLLNKQLRISKPDSEVRNVARARTLTVLQQLDGHRKGNLIQFLSESKLLEIISLSGADLSGARLFRANLSGADLSGAILVGTVLSNANLSNANLSDAFMLGAQLGRANLSDANLSKANLSGALLLFANLSGADLRGAYLGGPDLGDAYLGGANLSFANLKDAHYITKERLEKHSPFFLKGAIMPDGSKHP